MRLLNLAARFVCARPSRRLRALVTVVCLLASAPALEADTVTAMWDANPESNIAGYVLKYGILPGVYTTTLDVGKVTSRQVTLAAGQRYYFAVQAYNTSSLYSPLSAEVFIDIPAANNLPPVLTNPGNRTNAENASISLQLSASDPDGDTLSYSATNLPGGLSINSATGLISGTLSYSSAGTHSVTATASDGGLSNSKTFTWTVTDVNQPPTVSLTAPAAGATYPAPATITVNANASDADGTLTKVDFYANTTLIGTDTTSPYSVTWNSVAAGAYSLTAVATDNALATKTSPARAITVTEPLPAGWTAGDIGAPAVAGSTSYSGGVFTIEAAGVDIWETSDEFQFAYRQMSGDMDVIARVASVENADAWSKTGVMIRAALTGDAANATMFVSAASGLAYQRRTTTGAATVSTNTSGQAPTWLKLERRGGTITAFWSSNGGTWNTVGTQSMTLPATIYVGLAVTSHNASTSITSVIDNVTVTAVTSNQAPTLTAVGNQTHAENASVSLQLVGSDPDGDVLSYSATSLPGGLSINSTTGLISGTLSYTSAGTHSVTATTSDGSLSNSKTFTWTVTNTNRAPVLTNPGNRTNAENAAISLQLAASDPDSDVLSYSATNLPGGLSINSTTGLISGTLSSASAGTHSVTVTASDGSLSNSKTFTWTVTSTNGAPVLTSPGNRTNAENATISLQLSASDPDGDALTYSATNLPGGLSINSTTGLISGRLSYSSSGTHSVTATASDGSLSNSKTFTWTVTNVNRAPVMSTVANRTDVEGDAVSFQLQATDPDGDPITFSATGLPAGAVLNTLSGGLSGTIATGGVGTYTVAVSVSDGSLSDSGNFTWTIISTPSVPGAATPLTPNGLVNTSTPSFTWSPAAGASWYIVRMINSLGALTDVWYSAAQAGCGTGTCAITPSGALPAGPSTWSLLTWNSAGYGPWSLSQAFVINLQGSLAMPVAVRPIGVIASRIPDFAWSAVPSATWYWLQVKDADGVRFEQWFTSASLGCPAGTGTCTANPGFVLAEGAALWKVQPWNSTGHGPWTSEIAVTVGAPPGPAVLLSPFGTITNSRPTYSWNAAVGASYYILRVNDSSGTPIDTWYSTAAVGCGSGTGVCSVTPGVDIAPGAASWAVLPWNSIGYGTWPAAAQFRRAVSTPPAATPISPVGGVTVTGPITLTWTAVPDATYYIVRIVDSLGATTDGWYTADQAGCLLGSGTCSVAPAMVPASGWVDWTVLTWNSFGYGSWSVVGSFQKP